LQYIRGDCEDTVSIPEFCQLRAVIAVWCVLRDVIQRLVSWLL